jgi:hypothetical protein
MPTAAEIAKLTGTTEGELLLGEIAAASHEAGARGVLLGASLMAGVGIGLGVREFTFRHFGETPGAALYELTHEGTNQTVVLPTPTPSYPYRSVD